METTKQPDAPNCYKCDDMGYMPGDEVFGVSRCSCPIGVTVDMRASGTTFRMMGEIKASANTPKPLLERAYDLIDEARAAGQVLTIDLVPLDPLAMGNYEMVAGLRPARQRATINQQPSLEASNKAIKKILDEMEPHGLMDGAIAAYKDLLIQGHGAYIAHDDGTTEHVPVADMMIPVKTMAYPDRRTEAAKVKVIWPDPSKMNFTPDRRDPYSTLTQEQHDRRSYDRNKK